MAASFVRELRDVWRRQNLNWRTVVTRQVFNRFIRQLTLQYSNIFIRDLGASAMELGAVNSASGLGSTLISLPLGYFQDRYSIRKIYLLGISILTLSPLLFALADRWEFVIPAILIAGLCERLGSCVIICDLSLPNEDRATGKALCEGIGALPTLLSPTIAALLVTMFGGMNVEGIRPLYWIQFVAQVLLVVYTAKRMVEVERPVRKSKSINPIEEFREVFRRGTATKRWLLFLATNYFTMSMINPFMYLFAHEVKGSGPFIIGGITTAMILAEALFAAPLGRITDRIGRKKMFYMLTPVYCLSYVIFVLAPSQEWLLLAGFLMGFKMLSYVAYGAMTPELVPRDCIGRWRGLIGLCLGLAAIPGPIVGGWIWENIGPMWVFIIPIFVELFIRMPLLYTVPETLHNAKNDI
ncbi:MAG: MFS transporter [Candidatus Bathyarchaeota archaeon]|nr:MFS transporter [Candidatus Bathyarchaeota archaeon]